MELTFDVQIEKVESQDQSPLLHTEAYYWEKGIVIIYKTEKVLEFIFIKAYLVLSKIHDIQKTFNDATYYSESAMALQFVQVLAGRLVRVLSIRFKVLVKTIRPPHVVNASRNCFRDCRDSVG